MERVRLAELCAATSLFTDLGTGQPSEHGLRTCLVAMRLAESLGLDARQRRELFYVSLLRFLGCTADAHHVAELGGGDETQFLAGMAQVTMGSPREEMSRMLGVVAAGRPLPLRFRALAGALADPKAKERLLGAHCEVAARLADRMGLPAGVSAALAVAYARWDGQGVPAGVGGTDIPVSVRISIVARDLDLWAREAGADAALQVLEDRRARAYDPEVVDAVRGLGLDILPSGEHDPWDEALALEPLPQAVASGWEVDRVLEALGDFADLKLPERSGYSRRITRTVSAAGASAGLPAAELETLIRAARVHDLGVVGVPTATWRESPRPGTAEWERFRLHPYWSAQILGRCHGLRAVAAMAGRHHERLDGSGYPAGSVSDLGTGAGILAVAVLFDEHTSGQAPSVNPAADTAAMMVRLADGGALRRADVDAVLGAVGMVAPASQIERPAGLTEREVEVLSLLARGGTNRQIAEALWITSKTVGSHVEHIYTKAGVRSRAAATLFAMQHDLIG